MPWPRRWTGSAMSLEPGEDPPSTDDLSGPGQQRSRRLAAGVLFAAAIAVTFVVARATVTPAEHAAQRSAPAQRPVIVHATRQRLVDLRLGTCDLSVSARTMKIPAGGAEGLRVFTQVHLTTGQGVGSGTLVAEVSGRPLIALDVPFPLYRDIAPGDRGPDVTAVQEALGWLGRLDAPFSGTFDNTTQAAVARLYEDLGTVAARTGADVDEAARTAEAAENDLRTRAATDPAVTNRELRDAAETRRQAQARIGVTVPAAEIVQPPKDMTVRRVVAAVGSPAEPDTPIAELRGSTATATCTFPTDNDLDAGQAATLRAATGDIAGTIGPTTANEDSTITAAFTPTEGSLPVDLVGTPVPVEVTVNATSGEVLTVPAGTLREATGGGSAVAVRRSDGTTRTVPVTVGLVVDGHVEITGDIQPTDDLLVAIETNP